MSDNSIWYEDRAPSVKALQAKIAELEAALQECQDANSVMMDKMQAERDAALVANRDLVQIARNLQAECDAAREAAAAWKAKAQEWRGVALGYWVQEFRRDTDTRLSIYGWMRRERWMRNDGR